MTAEERDEILATISDTFDVSNDGAEALVANLKRRGYWITTTRALVLATLDKAMA